MTARGAVAAVAAVALASLTACSGTPAPAAPTRAPAAAANACSATPTTPVTNGDELTEALAGARPGTVIGLAPGTYTGTFVATAQGTAAQPITVCGSRDAVIDGGAIDGGYAVHLDGASYWQLSGFTVRGGQKGVMVDAATGVLVENLLVEGTGDEGIHLRKASSDDVVRGNTVRHTGLRNDKFGEGIYIGSAKSNWCNETACEPDRSDRNLVEGNTISRTTAESVDIKEGTTGGILRDNTFSGAGQTDADSWVDVKGNGWTIVGNTGTDSSGDGFQVHEILDGWGLDNTFKGNTAAVNGGGYGINVTKNPERNRVGCDNRAVDAGKGLSPSPCA